MAARRVFRVPTLLWRSCSRCSRKATRSATVKCSIIKAQGRKAEPLCRIEDEQPEALGVALHGVPAQASLAGQVVLQGSGEAGGKVSHGKLLSCGPVRQPRPCRAAGPAWPPGTSRLRRHWHGPDRWRAPAYGGWGRRRGPGFRGMGRRRRAANSELGITQRHNAESRIIPSCLPIMGGAPQRFFWAGARQKAAGSERRRPGPAPLGEKTVGLSRWLRPSLWGLFG